MSLKYIEQVKKNGIWREEHNDSYMNDVQKPDGCCELHYLPTVKTDRCEMQIKSGLSDVLMGSCRGCKYFIK